MADERLEQLEKVERAFDAADAYVGLDRHEITRKAQEDVKQALEMTDVAIRSDEDVDEATRLRVVAERTGNRANAKMARSKERAARKKAKADHRQATNSLKGAYDAIRFSDVHRLGFLRVIMVLLILAIVGLTFTLTTYIKGNYELTADEILQIFTVVFDAVTLWLIMKRKKLTRAWVIATSSFNIIVGTTIGLLSGTFDLGLQVTKSFFDIFMLIYFIRSRRVKIVLSQPFNVRTLNDDLDEDESFFRPTTWEFWRNQIIYFNAFSIVGHWMEAAVCLLIKYGIVPGEYDPTSQIWSDWLYPFPVYGIGFCACAILLYPIKNILQRKFKKTLPALATSFIINALVCTVIEFAMGMMVNADLQLWDYSNMFGNFMGQVCLQNALFFGFVATIMTWVVYPALERLFRRIPNEAVNGIFVVSLIALVILYAMYYINVTARDVSAVFGVTSSEFDAVATSSSA